MLKTVLASDKNGCEAGIGLDSRVYVGPSNYSKAYNATLGTDDAVVNIIPAKADHIFVMTDIILKGNKNISATTDATVDIYEADSATNSTALNTILSVPLERSGRLVLNSLFLSASEARYINGKTSDDDVFVTILGYYVKIEEV